MTEPAIPEALRRPHRAASFGIVPLGAAWGSSFLFMRVAGGRLGFVGVAEGRALFAALVVALLLLCRRRAIRLGQGLSRYVGLGLLMTTAPYLGMAYATERQGAALTAIFFATVPLFSAGIGIAWGAPRPSARMVSGLVIGLAGVVVVVALGHPDGLSTDALGGYGAALAAAASSALGANYSRRHFTGEDPLTQTMAQSVSGALLVIPAFAAAPPHHWPSVADLGALAALAVICTAFAYTLLFWLVAELGATRALTAELLVPAFASLWGFLALGERLAGTSFFGGALIILGCALVMGWRPSRWFTALLGRRDWKRGVCANPSGPTNIDPPTSGCFHSTNRAPTGAPVVPSTPTGFEPTSR